MDFNAFDFSHVSEDTTPRAGDAFEAGERYNARICAVIPAIKPPSQYCPASKAGMLLVLAIEDGDGELVVKASPFYGLVGSYLFSKAAFCQLMQGLLGTTASGPEMSGEMSKRGIHNPYDLVGMLCTVEMTRREGNNGRVFWNVASVRGVTKRQPGFAIEDDTDVHVGRYAFSKFLQVDIDRARALPGVTFEAVPANDNDVMTEVF